MTSRELTLKCLYGAYNRRHEVEIIFLRHYTTEDATAETTFKHVITVNFDSVQPFESMVGKTSRLGFRLISDESKEHDRVLPFTINFEDISAIVEITKSGKIRTEINEQNNLPASPIELNDMEKAFNLIIEAEKSVLGAALTNSELFFTLVKTLKPNHFALPHHTYIFQAMKNVNAHYTSIDAQAVVKELKRTGTLDVAGGIEYIAELTQTNPHRNFMMDINTIIKGHEDIRDLATLQELRTKHLK